MTQELFGAQQERRQDGLKHCLADGLFTRISKGLLKPLNRVVIYICICTYL